MLTAYASLPAQTVPTIPCSSLTPGGAMVQVTASNLGGLTPLTGIVSFQATLANGVPASFQMPGGGQIINLACTAYAVAGAFSVTLPDVTLTNPANICFNVTAKRTGVSVLGPGYTCVQPHGTPTGPTDWFQVVNGTTVCNFDDYVPVLTPSQTAFPALPPAPDMVTVWNSMVSANIASGNTTTVTTLTDAATVTWNAANPTLNTANLQLFTQGPPSTKDGLNARAVNLTGMVAGGRYMLAVLPWQTDETGGTQTVTLGTGCTWQWTLGNVPMNINTFTIPAWAHNAYLVVWTYDGTNCIGTVVD